VCRGNVRRSLALEWGVAADDAATARFLERRSGDSFFRAGLVTLADARKHHTDTILAICEFLRGCARRPDNG
jgi:hypothetical protein